jgi:hypothetical protein
MRPTAVVRSVLLSFLCIMLPVGLRADILYSLTGTYSPYTVSISFDTSLSGAALDNLSSDNITSTVSNFSETNTIPANGSAALDVIISTNSLGNITAFTVTDTSDQVVTATEDSGETAGTPPTYAAPPKDDSGGELIDSFNAGVLTTGIYVSGGSCAYFNNGELFDDADGGACPKSAVETSTGSPPEPVSASGSGTFTSVPPNPGVTTVVIPEPGTLSMLAAGLSGLLALAARRGARRER